MVISRSGSAEGALRGGGPGAFEIRQGRADVHSRVVGRREATRGIGGELGQGIERQVDLQGAALHAQVGYSTAEVLVEMVWRHEVEKRDLGISVGDHDRRGNLVPGVEDYPGRPAIGDGDVLDRCPRSQDRPMRRGSPAMAWQWRPCRHAQNPTDHGPRWRSPYNGAGAHRRSRAWLDRHACQ
jgi:hypothetical protein